MFDGQFVLTQWMHFLPRHEFNACVERYQAVRRPRSFSCRDQLFEFGLRGGKPCQYDLFLARIENNGL